MQGRFAEVMFAGVMMLAWVMLTAPQALAPQYQLVQGIIPFSPSSPSHWTVGQSPDSLDCTCEVCGRSPAPIVTCPVRALGLRSQHWVGGCLPYTLKGSEGVLPKRGCSCVSPNPSTLTCPED